jgi:hypothetical protein
VLRSWSRMTYYRPTVESQPSGTLRLLCPIETVVVADALLPK